jgi:adenosylhomocysteine nucleosidase
MDMPKVAIVAAIEREVSGLTRSCRRVEQQYEGRSFVFFECDEMVVVCGGIGVESARRATEAVIALYGPTQILSVGFAGALDASLHVGDVFEPSVVIDARDGSRISVAGGDSQHSLVTFMSVAGAKQKMNLAQAFAAKAVDMEAAAVAAAAHAHGIGFRAMKVISDDLDFEMPEMARFIDAQGHFQTASFAAFVALRPALWKRVAALSRNSRRAAQALGERLERYRQELRQASNPGAIPESQKPRTFSPAPQSAPAEVATGSSAARHK